jgi:hypothetical protein
MQKTKPRVKMKRKRQPAKKNQARKRQRARMKRKLSVAKRLRRLMMPKQTPRLRLRRTKPKRKAKRQLRNRRLPNAQQSLSVGNQHHLHHVSDPLRRELHLLRRSEQHLRHPDCSSGGLHLEEIAVNDMTRLVADMKGHRGATDPTFPSALGEMSLESAATAIGGVTTQDVWFGGVKGVGAAFMKDVGSPNSQGAPNELVVPVAVMLCEMMAGVAAEPVVIRPDTIPVAGELSVMHRSSEE